MGPSRASLQIPPPRMQLLPLQRRGCAARGKAERGAAAASVAKAAAGAGAGEVRVRFAPSPTGSLHVGGARTALFNWLFARKLGGKLVLRIEDTDLERSTRESEEAMIADLRWLELDWDEGPDRDGGRGPYRQSERTAVYKKYADELVAKGAAYPCFSTDADIEAMKAKAEAEGRPPVYDGTWRDADPAVVAAKLAAGEPHTYRFRVEEGRRVAIQDLVRGEVGWDSGAVGDFIILRSNGQPVYNFCVAVDDATMAITHVIRAEEHLPNTLRQVMIYEALGFAQPQFAHCSLILAPDRSKLSKRHGAVSVGQYRADGFTREGMINYLSLLGWNDGTEKEVYSVDELVQAFSLERITKSPAVFDTVKLRWMNAQHIRGMDPAEVVDALCESLVTAGAAASPGAAFLRAAAPLLAGSVETWTDADAQLKALLGFELAETVASEKCASFLKEGKLAAFARDLVAAAEAGDCDEASAKQWANAYGKEKGLKGKNLFMPLRICTTGRMEGPDVVDQLAVLKQAEASGECLWPLVPFRARIETLKAWALAQP